MKKQQQFIIPTLFKLKLKAKEEEEEKQGNLNQLAQQIYTQFMNQNNNMSIKTKYLLNNLPATQSFEPQFQKIIHNIFKMTFQRVLQRKQLPINMKLKFPSFLFFFKNQLYVSDRSNHRILRYDFKNQKHQIIAGGHGSGKQANQLNYPNGFFIDKNNNIYIADGGNHRIMCWKMGQIWGRIVAGGKRGSMLNQLNTPTDVILVKETMIISDFGNNRLLKWRLKQNQGFHFYGSSSSNNYIKQLYQPFGLFYDKFTKSIYLADRGNNRILKIYNKENAQVVAGLNGRGRGEDQLYYPTSICKDKNNVLYICDSFNNRIICKKHNQTLQEVDIKLNGPTDIKISQQNRLYISDTFNHQIKHKLI